MNENFLQVFARMVNVSTEVFPTSYETVNGHASKKQTSRLATADMFRNVSSKTLRKLKVLYSPDYEIFGYELPSWLKAA